MTTKRKIKMELQRKEHAAGIESDLKKSGMIDAFLAAWRGAIALSFVWAGYRTWELMG